MLTLSAARSARVRSPAVARVVLFAFAFAVACACENKPSTGATGPIPKEAPPLAHAASAVRATDTPALVADAAVAAREPSADACNDGEVRGGKSIGHTSTVFKLELASGKKVAWKPNAKKVRGRYKGEIAAFRLASALGLDNVLPACPRAFDVAAISTALTSNPEATNVLASEALVENDKVFGASIDWFDGLSFWPLEKEPLRTESRSWLTAGRELPAAKTELARQTSTLIVFDFITGNWDRFSGENVGIDKAGTRLLYIDNDAAFMEAPPKASVVRRELDINATDRFSRALVTRIRELDDERLQTRLARIFGDESPERPLLSPTVISLVARRITDLVAVIDRKTREHGENETLFFR